MVVAKASIWAGVVAVCAQPDRGTGRQAARQDETGRQTDGQKEKQTELCKDGGLFNGGGVKVSARLTGKSRLHISGTQFRDPVTCPLGPLWCRAAGRQHHTQFSSVNWTSGSEENKGEVQLQSATSTLKKSHLKAHSKELAGYKSLKSQLMSV